MDAPPAIQLSLRDVISIIAVFQLLFFAAFLVLKRGGRLCNRILALFLFAQAIVIAESISFSQIAYVYAEIPQILFIGLPFTFLWGPTLYLYTVSLAFSDFRLTRRSAAHFLPFVLMLVYLTGAYHIHSAADQRQLLGPWMVFPRSWWLAQIAARHVQILVYLIWAQRRLRQYRAQLNETFSSTEETNLSWLSSLLYAYTGAWLVALSTNIAAHTKAVSQSSIETAVLLVFLTFLAFFNFIIYKALSSPDLFLGVEARPKYGGSALAPEERDQCLTRLDDHMASEKPYLRPDLKLSDLARELSVPPWQLSQAINQGRGQSFFDFINHHRIEAASDLLKTDAERTVLEILYQVGYNSKSAFNKAFKKQTGLTPTQFRRTQGPI